MLTSKAPLGYGWGEFLIRCTIVGVLQALATVSWILLCTTADPWCLTGWLDWCGPDGVPVLVLGAGVLGGCGAVLGACFTDSLVWGAFPLFSPSSRFPSHI